jgi:hypothetical protein
MTASDPAPEEPSVRQPLPPEQPPPEGGDAQAPQSPPVEWWRSSPPAQALPGQAGSLPPDRAGEADDDAGDAGRGPGVREEWRQTWETDGRDGIAAAHEIGAYIGDAVASRLPDPHAAAQRRGLDIRWLRLKYNVPGIALAVLVTWGGRSATDRMISSVGEGGILAPLGWVLLAALLLGVLMVIPIGSALGAAVGHLVTSLVHGLVSVFGRAWSTPYIGYLLRVLLAVAAWSFVFAVLVHAGRGILHLLTGV